MNYYERHLGDYARDTAHLTMLEHGAYTLLMDRYYVSESGIPQDQAHRLARARTREEKQAVDTVLNEFFTLNRGVWIKGRIEEEISKAQSKIKAAQENGKKGGRPKQNQIETKNKPSGFSVGSENKTQEKAHHTPDTRHHLKPNEETHSVEDCIGFEKTPIGIVCVAIKAEFDLQNKSLTDMNQSNPTLIALVEAGATEAEFADAAKRAASSNKGFGYALGIVKRQREEAAKLKIHKGAMPQQQSKTQSIHDKRSATAKAMFGDNSNANNQSGSVIDVSDYSVEPDRPLISAHG